MSLGSLRALEALPQCRAPHIRSVPTLWRAQALRRDLRSAPRRLASMNPSETRPSLRVRAAESAPESVSDGGLPRTATVGVLGGGQLGRMFALAAGNMDVKVIVLDPSDPAPAAVAAKQLKGSFRDPAKIVELARQCDVLTVEIEHVDVDALEAASKETGVPVCPAPATLRFIQDKYAQKVHFRNHNVPLPEFKDIPDKEALMEAAGEFGFPLMLKAKRLAYDGRGNYAVRSAEDLERGVEQLGGYAQGLYAEKWAPFVKELAVMVAREGSGRVVAFPLVETVHADSICLVTECPAAVPRAVADKAQEVAMRAVASLEGAGVFGVEMFWLSDGTVLLNEVAPRPHNSGHYTIEACRTSQFEQHLRAVLGWPLGDPSLHCGSAIMFNILGEADGEAGVRAAHRDMRKALEAPGAKFHWYGKEGVNKARKVGHVTVCAGSRDEARRRLGDISATALALLRESDARASQAGLAVHREVAGSSPGAPRVGIIMGSDSDLPTMAGAAEVLREFGVACEVTVVSAHRTPARMMEYARTAHSRGLEVIIAGAGGAAHLPGMVASMTPLPVIGVPCIPKGYPLDGMDALLSIVCMPKGVPVATVAIGNAANAGLLAVRMMAGTDETLRDKMMAYQAEMESTVLGKAQALEAQGWERYGKAEGK